MTPAQVAHIMALVNDYAIAVASVAHEMSDKNDFLKLNSARAAVEAALRGAAQADPVAWHVNFRGSSHLLTSLESVDLTDCIVTPLYPEPRAPDNTLKDRLLAALERAAGAESALRRLTAAEPPELSMSMFASAADFEAAKRRAAVEPDERAMANELIKVAAWLLSPEPRRKLAELEDATHIGHRQFHRAYEGTFETLRLKAIEIRNFVDAARASKGTPL